MAVLSALPLRNGLAWALAACVLSAAAGGSVAYGLGFRHAQALGDTALGDLKTKNAEQSATNAKQSQEQLLAQVIRANAADALLIQLQEQHKTELQLLQERIPHVTTHYRPAPGATTQPIPRCVFTAGWLRDYNAALGVPATTQGAAASHPQAATSAAPGTDAELLESGVTPADILAHAQDYGLWARNNLAHLNALLDLQEKD
ncbi:lysis protein [Pseudomonas rubra]|uniref:Lysis protein n=1 Tax=Pseudomonas rubra TaxID=2942627 RepID=A0ABT5PF83_9PSED|nr:lysis protein [Pseudomonas rubra]MDD1016852.1 lysis protein [Pseudomonas rubra]MDD1041491.1 lysis protein [Pseudomonas rubra]MDD1154996.1 lysis protein [Pseudomonas rubra]